MVKRLLIIGCIVAAVGAAPLAQAGDRCDDWYRTGHGTGDSHRDSDTSDIPGPGGPVHSESGHHVVRHYADSDPDHDTYVEVIGGQSYKGNAGGSPNEHPGQGGFTQGAAYAQGHTVTFNAGTFGPDTAASPTTWADDPAARVCVKVDGLGQDVRHGNP